MRDHNLLPADPDAHVALGRMFKGALFVEDAPQAVAGWIADLRLRIEAREPEEGHCLLITLYPRGGALVSVGDWHFGGWSTPLADALAQAHAFANGEHIPPRLSVVKGG